MADDRTLAYAEALFDVARAEGTLGEVEDELFRFARALEGNDELRDDAHRPAHPGEPGASRSSRTCSAARRRRPPSAWCRWWSAPAGPRELPASSTRLVETSARRGQQGGGRGALGRPAHRRPARPAWPRPSTTATGKQVEVKVVVDPSVLGGIVAQVGDTVIDGSVRRRLDQLRERTLRVREPRSDRGRRRWLS